jgi:hypothetical protein
MIQELIEVVIDRLTEDGLLRSQTVAGRIRKEQPSAISVQN